ncbi:alpha/beta fold hydrolase [Demequina sp. SO4-18]|uniref:alpha/beta fold hydrolase n=1 Tax=Demequina sp. SO4-18 TaxID=3401026 RepID=UPI003B5A1FC4
MGDGTRIVTASDGRRLCVRDAGSFGSDSPLTLFWHHGTPGLGLPPQPLLALADQLGLRLIGHDRPGYGGSDRLAGRLIGHAAADVADIADALGITRYAVMGYSGGGPHALACAAADPRVVGAIVVAGLAPRSADGLDWYADMIASGRHVLSAAEHGEEARRLAEHDGYDPEFNARDLEALDGPWSWLGDIAGAFTADDLDGAIDDDLSYVRDWDVDLDAIGAATLVIHGTEDRIAPVSHGTWVAERIGAQLWKRGGDGHVSAVQALPEALRWLRDTVPA